MLDVLYAYAKIGLKKEEIGRFTKVAKMAISEKNCKGINFKGRKALEMQA